MEKKEPLDAAGGRMAQPVCKTVWRVFKKQKLKLPHDPAVSLLGIHI